MTIMNTMELFQEDVKINKREETILEQETSPLCD